MKRRDFIQGGGALLAAAPFMNFGAGRPLGKKMLVLGFDGMDPGIVNRLIRELGPLSAVAPPFPLAAAAIAPLRAKAEAAGNADFSPLWSGQNACGCREVPAAQLTRELAGALQRAG